MSLSALSAAEVALVTNDKPVLIAANALESATTAKWLTGDPLSGTTQAHADAPVSRAYDRYQHLQTYPVSDQTTWFLSFDLGASVIDWDCLIIGGHNFGTIGGLTVSLEIGTSDAFSSVTELFTTTPGTSNKRICSFNLYDTSGAANPARMSEERYVRIKMTKGGGFTPKIGEVFLGRRRHLPYKFDRELDDLRTGSEMTQFVSRSGVATNYTFSRGRQARQGTTLIDESADIETVKSFWSETNQGTKPFWFCEDPGTSPATIQFMNQEPQLSFPVIGPNQRALSLNLIETAPFVALEV